ncbi:MAG: diphthine--ammonia ligase [Candidatus Kapaibacterium sp.]
MSSAFAMWSGGKDSHYALQRALQAGMECELLVTFIDEETDLVMSHRLPPELIEEQARLVGIPLLKVRATYATYERALRNTLFDIRSEGITCGIFGDIYLREHREWFENITSDFSIRPIFPLWGIPTALLIEEQRRAMRSVIIQIERRISEAYLGRDITKEFIEYLGEQGLDPCGESGEYHTFVCRSPLMEGEIILTHAERRATTGSIGLEIDYWKVVQGRSATRLY